ncbi:hypothetical protein ACH498_25070 [Rhodococcus erythropolis]
MFDIANRGHDYVLRWPRELFVLEAKAILAAAAATGWRSNWDSEASLLLAEAFVADTPQRDFDAIAAAAVWSAGPRMKESWDLSTDPPDPRCEFLEELVDATPEFEAQHDPRPYYSQRIRARNSVSRVEEPDLDRARREWRDALGEFRGRGYLAKVAPEPCVDDDHSANPNLILDALLEELLGSPNLWVTADDWDEPTFFDLIEVFHDLVARPRRRQLHSYGNCGWHYSAFAPRPAQILYRWTVNRILARCGIGLRLAESGEDTGRLVHEFGDARRNLIAAAMNTPDPTRKAAVEHAISLFRGRAAGVEEKRSACVVLAGLLEERRALVKEELLTADERDLFVVANKFGIRHRGADQRTNYDPAYLDWIYWWYIATFELIDRLVAAQADGSPTAPPSVTRSVTRQENSG